MESIRAAIGDQNLQSAFWLMVGSLILSNAGLIVGAIISHIKNVHKMRLDLNEAFRRIRILEKQNEKGEEK